VAEQSPVLLDQLEELASPRPGRSFAYLGAGTALRAAMSG
jgi:hypothetical protein